MCIGLFRVLSSICRALLSVYMALLSVCRTLLSVCKETCFANGLRISTECVKGSLGLF